jgi:ABC-type nitrate/sulfonate/bicarbonate transport system permease component
MRRAIDWPPVVLILLLLGAWEVVPRLVGAGQFPPVSNVLVALWQDAGEIARQVAHTLRRAAFGFLLAAVTMIPLGIVIGRSRGLAAVLEPVIDLLRPLPPIAIVPVVMLFAGIGDAAKVSVITFAAAFPILIHAIDGVRGIHPMYSTVSRSLRLAPLEQRFSVDLHAVMPVLFMGLRLAIASALLVAVTSEMLMSTDGIGLFILHAQERFQLASGLAAIVVVAIVGWAVNRLLQVVDRRLLAWHHATTGDHGT